MYLYNKYVKKRKTNIIMQVRENNTRKLLIKMCKALQNRMSGLQKDNKNFAKNAVVLLVTTNCVVF